MALRGYTDCSPVNTSSNQGSWPDKFINEPKVQFVLLRNKYLEKPTGRIPLPRNNYELWCHYKYSVMARSQSLYRDIGKRVASKSVRFDILVFELVRAIRSRPGEGNLRNAIQHMWGHVSGSNALESDSINTMSLERLLTLTQKKAKELNEPYLLQSTALSELMVWL